MCHFGSLYERGYGEHESKLTWNEGREGEGRGGHFVAEREKGGAGVMRDFGYLYVNAHGARKKLHARTISLIQFLPEA